MAKTHHKKKKHRNRARPATSPTTPATPPIPTGQMTEALVASENKSDAVISPAAEATADFSSYNYVQAELRRIGLLAIIFVAAQIILWAIFVQTSVGPAIYRLVKV